MQRLRSFVGAAATSSAIVIAALASLWPASAQADDPDPRLGVYLRKPETRQAITDAINEQVAGWNIGCSSVAISNDAKIYIHSPVAFADGSDTPRAGSWMESLNVEACGETHVHNIESIAGDGGVELVRLLNGTTHTNLTLQRDAAGFALMGAGLKLKAACDNKFVIDTAFVDFQGETIANAKDGPQSRAWSEDWTVSACKQEIIVPMLFTPDDTGTGISVDGGGAKVKE